MQRISNNLQSVDGVWSLYTYDKESLHNVFLLVCHYIDRINEMKIF